MNWFDTCEVVVGQIMSGKVDPASVSAAHFCEPFDKIIRIAQKGRGSPERYADMLGPMQYQQALNRSETASGMKIDFVSQLGQKAALYEASQFLKKRVVEMERGETPDASLMESYLSRIYDSGERLKRLSEYEPDRDELMLTGFEPIDEHFGGIVKNGLTTIGGRPGTRKSWLMMEIICSYLREHKKEEAAVFTLEMSGGQLHHRVLDLMAVPEHIRKRIWVVEDIASLSEVGSTIAQIGDNCRVGALDFAEMALEELEEQSAGSVGRIFRFMAKYGLRTKRSMLLLSQLSRPNQQSGVPGMSRLKWAGEDTSGAIIMNHDPHAADSMVANDGDLPIEQGWAYLAFVKSRFSFRNGTKFQHDGPGVVHVPIADYGGFKNAKGTKWFPIILKG